METKQSLPGVPFMRSQARILLKNKYVLFLGDSVQRAMYKDFIALLHNSEMLNSKGSFYFKETENTGAPSGQ